MNNQIIYRNLRSKFWNLSKNLERIHIMPAFRESGAKKKSTHSPFSLKI
ncbi:hypothetical protein DSOL_3942 [Desulfosporosinus metallidurans]|uniref:Uncharacterized protein n=1 Tax=Desulfosporosinus metallidurans TaxID=1888891 RepID=A0A1Q8QN04_9FIRM|nr:hypothetical protein DSOL_3942 [Desulfosporosinus metallidurans]